tara:strand:- start:398 stop:715 length:318 start_codon:yes stop_codon:yes gene_type:complete
MTNNGSQLRDKGIKKALDNANNTYDKWSDRAYKFLVNYIKSQYEFMTEDVRIASEKEIPKPPSGRAWGGIILKASRAGLIDRVGFSNVKNAKAHKTPASIWRVNS